MHTYDLIIIGGGPTGINVGISAKDAALDYLILEKGVLANSIYNFPTYMTFFSTSRKLEIGNIPFVSHLQKPTRLEALEYYRRITDTYALNIHYYEPAIEMDKQADGTFLIKTEKGTYHTRSVVVATGFYDSPNLMNIPGEDLPKVRHYYNDPHPYVGQKVLVVGARNSACDAALETWYKGAEVSMAIRGEEIHQRVKYWIRPNIVNRIKEDSIRGYFKTVVREIRPKEVVLEGPDGVFTIENDFVLAMTGYQPNFGFLRSLGISISPDDVKVPAYDACSLETNVPNVYLAGVVCGGMETNKLFIENTRDHGEKIVADILKKRERVGV